MPKVKATHTITFSHPEWSDVPDDMLPIILEHVGDQPVGTPFFLAVLKEFGNALMLSRIAPIKINTTVEVKEND